MRPRIREGASHSDFLVLWPTMPDLARAAMFVLASPPHVRIDELVLSPMSQRGGF
ncbi:hypothetical protein [Clavibacter nebraskensis]|uniref:hypothetical protein n=1 Tax=Clavibacter nebraskensis TaxID=31963 RepID=UPI0003464317|nr:hypothetical protein [Clavibacter nebraskensis]